MSIELSNAIFALLIDLDLSLSEAESSAFLFSWFLLSFVRMWHGLVTGFIDGHNISTELESMTDISTRLENDTILWSASVFRVTIHGAFAGFRKKDIRIELLSFMMEEILMTLVELVYEAMVARIESLDNVRNISRTEIAQL